MNKINKEEAEAIIKWAVENPEAYEVDIDEYFFDPLMKAFGDNVNKIIEYLNSMDVDDLDYISGCFSRIYKKFMTEEVWDALEKLEKKIEEESTRMKEFRKREEMKN